MKFAYLALFSILLIGMFASVSAQATSDPNMASNDPVQGSNSNDPNIAVNDPHVDPPATSSQTIYGGGSKKCVTVWAYDESGWYKRDLYKEKIWVHARTGVEKKITKIIDGDRCKAIDPFTEKFAHKITGDVPFGFSFLPRDYRLPYDWYQNYLSSLNG